MSTKIAINGFGRIGRMAFRAILADPGDLEVVAINDIAPLDNLAYLLRFDSVHRNFFLPVEVGKDTLVVGDKAIRFCSERDPANLPWGEMGVQIAMECTGFFTSREGAAKHLQAGAKKVIISAPARGEDLTICMGVNEEMYDPAAHHIISNASCTTNCLAPVAKVLDEEFGIVQGFLTTVHAFTAGQGTVDSPSGRDMRRGRAASINIVPASTGAAVATALVLPQLKGKMDGLAMRVPVANGSIVDFVAVTEKPVTVESVNAAFIKAAQTPALQGILEVTDQPIVSSDVIGNSCSSLVDLQSTMVVGTNFVKVLSWYDNEWGYSCRLRDLANYMAARL